MKWDFPSSVRFQTIGLAWKKRNSSNSSSSNNNNNRKWWTEDVTSNRIEIKKATENKREGETVQIERTTLHEALIKLSYLICVLMHLILLLCISLYARMNLSICFWPSKPFLLKYSWLELRISLGFFLHLFQCRWSWSVWDIYAHLIKSHLYR